MTNASKLPINTTASADDMAEKMFGDSIKIVSASYTGAAHASGIFSDGDATAPGVTPSDTGVILSTGNAKDITNSSGDANRFSDTTTENNTAGDDDLDKISGQETFDAAVFEATFVPAGSILSMQVVFSSEEYLEYVKEGFNDAVGVWVNGEPAVLQVGSGNISIDEINDEANENLYIDNPADAEQYNTEMDGFTVTLTLKAPVIPGQENTIKIGIADGGDSEYDSNLLIAGESIQTALVAGDDDIEMIAGGEQTFDLLANDESATGSTLTITKINGQPVSVGDTVTLPTGEKILLTSTGIVLSDDDNDAETNTFTYTVEDEDGNTDVGLVNLTTTVPCFTAGTLIDTVQGPVLVEELQAGDQVLTLDNGPQPLKWIGACKLDAEELRLRPHLWPIKIAAGALAPGLPCHDLIVSPQHRVMLGSKITERMFGSTEVLVAAKKLVPHDGISVVDDTSAGVEYFHLLFEDHQVVFSNGMPTESLFIGTQTKKALPPEALAEITELFPQMLAANFKTAPARLIVKQTRKIDQLIVRHEKNGKALLDHRPASAPPRPDQKLPADL